jgi:outer membrane protein W
MGTVHYYFGGKNIKPYLGLGAGVFYVKRQFEIGLLTTNINKWQFGLAPEIGIMFPIDFDYKIIFKIKYNYAFKSGDAKALSYLGINIGILSATF